VTTIFKSGMLVVLTLVFASLRVLAQPVPDGYAMSRQGGTLVFSRTGDPDPDVSIRIVTAAPSGTPADVLVAWMAAHPPVGKQVQVADAPTLLGDTVAVSMRIYERGGIQVQEGLVAGRTPGGTIQVQSMTVPLTRTDIATLHGKASGAITRALVAGSYVTQLAGRSPQEAVVKKPLAPGTAGAPPTKALATTALATSDAQKLIGQISTVGFYTKTGMGYGGMLTFNPTPVVLFKNGEAVKDMDALGAPEGIARHRQQNPEDWTKWRRSGQTIELMEKDGWKKLYYTKTMDRLPAGFTLQGKYRSTSGGGNLAMGGTSAVAVWSDLAFDRDGNFASGGGAGSSSSTPGVGSVVTSGKAANQSGRYAIDGYTLTLRYGSGKIERRMIVTDTKDTGVIWLDGDGYSRAK
jgi:hypothetical protein